MNKNITSTFLLLLLFIFLYACGKRSNTQAREGIYSGHLYQHSYDYGNPPTESLVHRYDTFDLSFKLSLSKDFIYLKSSDESIYGSMKFRKKEFDENGVTKSGNFRYNITITKDRFYYHVNSYSPMGSGIGSGTTFEGYRH